MKTNNSTSSSAVLRAVTFITATLAALPTLAAQRTFVSTQGVDNPTCSLVAPCRTFTAAITALSAGGEVIVLDSGGYGPVTIARAAAIIAPPGVYAGVSVSSGDGITVNAGAGDTVVLRGLTVNGQGGTIGINFVAGRALHVENCVVANMLGHGISATAGLAVAPKSLMIRDTEIRRNGGAGLEANGFVSVHIDRTRSERNSGDGYRAFGAASMALVDSVAFENGGAGAIIDSTDNTAPTNLVADRMSFVANQGSGVAVKASAAGVKVTGSIMASDTVGNGAHGAVAQGDTAATINMSVTGSTASGNALSGIANLGQAGGTQVLTSRNMAMRNGAYGLQGAGPPFYTLQDNAVRNNQTGEVTGTTGISGL